MSLYEEVKGWRVPNRALSECLKEMEPDGRLGNEGIVLWLGSVVDGVATLSHLVALRGPNIRKTPLQIQIDPELFNEVSIFAESKDLILIGQIHSHPGTFTDLSATDIKYGVSTPYYLSLVAPHYAQDPRTTWQACGVHLYEPKKGFRRLRSSEVANRITLTDEPVALTVVGNA